MSGIRFSFPPKVSETCKERFTYLPNVDSDANLIELASHSASVFSSELSPVHLQILQQFGYRIPLHNLPRPEYLLVEGLPLDDPAPFTPESGYAQPSCYPVATATVLALAALTGMLPVSYKNENAGHLLRNVVALPGSTQRGSHGSVPFSWHADNPHLLLPGESRQNSDPIMDSLFLFCIKNKEQAATSLISVQDVLKYLSLEDQHELFKAQFTVSPPPTNQNSQEVCYDNLAILVQSQEGLHCRYDKGLIKREGLTAEALRAIDNFDKALDSVHHHRFVLQPGQCLVFNNLAMLHSRSGFTPLPNGEGRFLLRLYALKQKRRANLEHGYLLNGT